MAHFAKINDENEVVAVHCLDNAALLDDDGNESSEKGVAALERMHGGTWVQTSYNTREGVHLKGGTPLRFRYAGIGHTYYPDIGTEGAFVPRKPHPSWALDEDSAQWKPPVEMPDDPDLTFVWDEESVSWVEVEPAGHIFTDAPGG